MKYREAISDKIREEYHFNPDKARNEFGLEREINLC